jgi:hypothetical protein
MASITIMKVMELVERIPFQGVRTATSLLHQGPQKRGKEGRVCVYVCVCIEMVG